jgi:hypothetical protein
MPERRYDGPHAEVAVSLPDGTVVKVEKGKFGDFPNDVAKSLDEQGDDWSRKSSKPRKARKARARKARAPKAKPQEPTGDDGQPASDDTTAAVGGEE